MLDICLTKGNVDYFYLIIDEGPATKNNLMFDSTMSFSPHISNITCNAMRTLNFVKKKSL